MAVYGYTRVSSHEQVDNNSLAEQGRTIQALATLRGQQVDQIFVEEGVSGSVPLEERPAGAQMLALLQPGDTIIVTKLDRAFRSAIDALQQAEAWKRSGIKFVVSQLGHEPVNNGGGLAEFFFGIMAQVAQLERTMIAERMAEGRAAKRAKGGFTGGMRPFGYRVVGQGRDAKLEEDEDEQRVVRFVRQCREEGMSLRKTMARVEAEMGEAVSFRVVRRIFEEGSNGG